MCVPLYDVLYICIGEAGVDTEYTNGDFACLDNLYAEFKYEVLKEPGKFYPAILNYIPASKDIDLAALLNTSVYKIALSYFTTAGYPEPRCTARIAAMDAPTQNSAPSSRASRDLS